ncbi:MAG TPA: SusD/RagB family nutrient-binding outer membrane lipoprotein [Chitinophagaceae bacterium]|nr:SusD/RagB family nutrient-binding outer membrane lipoprotein [Chitinophagaceae bacterium]
MNYRKIIFATSIAVGLLTVQSCTKLEDFGNTNNNPNATTSPVTSALLTNALSQIGNTVWGNGITVSGGLFAQFFSETQYTEASRYTKPVFNADAYYAGPMYDLQNIINYNSDPATSEIAAANGSNANQIAVARIVKAYYFWILTDTYGDIPYFEALKGEGNLTYDKQSEIYPALLKELKEAADQFDGGAAVKGDILYGGDNTQWKKFANSMRVLMALRLSKINATLGKAEFAAALSHSAGVIESNSDNANLVAPGGVFNHPLYQYYAITQRDDYAVSATLYDFLNANGDGRAAAFGSSTIGFPYGLTRDNAVAFATSNPNYARLLHPSRRTATSPISVLSAAHVYLARAEAAQLTWTAENVASMYTTGIRRSWEEWGVYSDAAFNAYLAKPAVDLAGGSPLTKIQLQQWIAFFPNGTQGWANWRRTGVPALTPAPGAGLPIIRRIPYGPNDYNFNLANVTVAAAQYTVGGEPDSQDAKVWWDQ